MKGILKIIKKNFCKSKKPQVIHFDYHELADKHIDLSSKIEKAYRLDGLGASIINNIPNYEKSRETQITNILKLSQEPEEILNKLKKPHVHDPIGWGDEPIYSVDNKVCAAYQSFVARYPGDTVVYPEDPQLEKENTNVWPETIPNFRSNFNDLNKGICETFINLLYHFDKYLNSKLPGYDFILTKEMRNNFVNFNRSVLYKPLTSEGNDQQIWENWHTDIGMLTSVAWPLYFSKDLKRLEFNNSSFLFNDRQGNLHEASFNKDQMLVTTQDTMFILSAGLFPATPHCVKAANVPRDIYRMNHVTFFEPQYNQKMYIPTEETFEEIIEKDPNKFSFRSVKNFKQGTSYKEFFFTHLSLVKDNKKQ